jgi:hypothetical protein
MTDELENKLVEKYPDFFAGKDEPITQNLMAFGCECGDGWYELIDTFCKFVKRSLKNPGWVELKPEHRTGLHEGHVCAPYIAPEFKFVQIKEKFGTIRLYYSINQPDDPNHHMFVEKSIDSRYDRIWGQVQAYENYTDYLSGRTCETCGKPGKLYTGGWYVTLCPEHAKERGKDEEPEAL